MEVPEAIAALVCQLGSEEAANELFVQAEVEGRIDAYILRRLIESSVPLLPGEHAIQRHERIMRLVLAVARDLEKRKTASGEFKVSSRAREFFHWLRDTEERRFSYELARRHAVEREEVTQGQSAEARDFNRQWKRRMEAFNAASRRAAEEMRSRHEASLAEFVETKRAALVDHFKLHARDKETLEARRTLKKLSMAGDYQEAKKFQKHVDVQTKREAAMAEGRAEEELQKKHEVHKWQQRLELKGLMAKVERVQREHRAQDGRTASRSWCSRRRMRWRRCRRGTRASDTRSTCARRLSRAKPTVRVEPRQYPLSPRRRQPATGAGAGAWPARRCRRRP